MAEFDEALILTTPHLRGQKVGDAQWLLAGHNVYSDTQLPVHPYMYAIDKEYGPHTATASKEAKRLLGYPKDKQTNTFGQVLYNLLTGKADLPDDYRQRRIDLIHSGAVKIKAL